MEYESDHNDKEQKAGRVLEHYIRNYKIFIDTCSILHPNVDKFWENIIPFLVRYEKKIIIPVRVVEELDSHKSNKENDNLAKLAKESLKLLKKLMEKDLVELRGEKNDDFADSVFFTVFTKHRMKHKLLLITQDSDLAKDIYSLNENKSVIGNKINVKQINKYGFLSNFKWSAQNTKTINHAEDLDKDEVFNISKNITTCDDSIIAVTHIPTINENVYMSSGSIIKLNSKIGDGGEGVTYRTNTPYVAKIYKREKITKRKYEKLKLMLSKRIKYDGICYPVDTLYNSSKEFIGYIMPEAKGMVLQKAINKKFIDFPNWKKRDSVELCITILEKITYLHRRNILIGDINPANILVVSPKEVYFVDIDSYQIEGFPCPVGLINFTAPEIQKKNFSDFLRTMGNENFAVATLLFMIMLLGKPPYSLQGGENQIDNIMKMDFSYPFRDNSNKKTPEGPWRYIWSHLTFELKKAFYNTFSKNGDLSTENSRLSTNEWLSIFRRYLNLLDSGKLGVQDKMSEELFPNRHKKNPNYEYVLCRLCGHEMPKHEMINKICQKCLKKGEEYKCQKCGVALRFSNYEKYIKQSRCFKVCPKCFEHCNEIKIWSHCVDCGEQFSLTNNECDYYEGKGLNIPKRCQSCRGRKNYYSYSSSGGDSYNSNSTSVLKMVLNVFDW